MSEQELRTRLEDFKAELTRDREELVEFLEQVQSLYYGCSDALDYLQNAIDALGRGASK